MPPEVRFYPRARQDLVDHAAYLADQASPCIAARLLEAVEATAENLAAQPGKGRPWISPRWPRAHGLRV